MKRQMQVKAQIPKLKIMYRWWPVAVNLQETSGYTTYNMHSQSTFSSHLNHDKEKLWPNTCFSVIITNIMYRLSR